MTGPRSDPPMPMLTMLRIGLPVWPLQSPDADPVGEGGHAVEDLVHLVHDVDAVDDERRPFRHAERDVEDRAVLGHVDAVAGEHHVAALLELGLSGELEEQRERLVGDAVLGVVEVEPGGLDGQPLPAVGSSAKRSRRCRLSDLGVVLAERHVGGPFTQGRCGHVSLLSASWFRRALVVRLLSRPERSSSRRSGPAIRATSRRTRRPRRSGAWRPAP